jgi:hypothetical protein
MRGLFNRVISQIQRQFHSTRENKKSKIKEWIRKKSGMLRKIA